MPAHYVWQGQDLHLHCHIQPQASCNTIVGLHGDRLKLRITAAPVDGNANQQLIGWLATVFSVAKSDIAILHGESSRQKTIFIRAPKTLPSAVLITR